MVPVEQVYDQIRALAARHGVRRVVLFGSRARGTNLPKSDIDLASEGGDFDAFYDDVQNELWSLLKVDLVNLESGLSSELKADIDRDGVVLYEAL